MIGRFKGEITLLDGRSAGGADAGAGSGDEPAMSRPSSGGKSSGGGGGSSSGAGWDAPADLDDEIPF